MLSYPHAASAPRGARAASSRLSVRPPPPDRQRHPLRLISSPSCSPPPPDRQSIPDLGLPAQMAGGGRPPDSPDHWPRPGRQRTSMACHSPPATRRGSCGKVGLAGATAQRRPPPDVSPFFSLFLRRSRPAIPGRRPPPRSNPSSLSMRARRSDTAELRVEPIDFLNSQDHYQKE